ncbi:MAG: GAF domain-containing protein [Candidatus Dormibacterales bacterium]
MKPANPGTVNGPKAEGAGVPATPVATYSPEFLYQIIEVIGSGPDLGTILHRFVPLVTAATESHGCFIYLVEDSTLVLRFASAGYSHLEGKVRLALDEGLTGWVARTKRSAFIKDKSLEDPRVVYVPELEEEHYQSQVSVPILSRAGDAIGVITLHARAPHEFRPQDLAFLEHAASLIAGAIENARLYEEAVARVDQLTRLSDLAQGVAAAGTTDELLSLVADGCRDLLGAIHCEIYLLRADEQLELAVASRTRAAISLDARLLWSQVVASDGTADAARGLADLVWGKSAKGAPLFAALSTGGERVGLLCVMVDRAGRATRSLLASIAAYAAVAIRRRQMIESLEEKNLVKDFFEALAGGAADAGALRQQAAKLQCDLDAEHLVLQVVPWVPTAKPRVRAASDRGPVWRELATKIESRLRLELPRSIFDQREGFVRGLLRVPPAGADAAVETVRHAYQALSDVERGAVAIGLSNQCRGSAAILRGFEEAASAAQVGSLLRAGAGVFAYEELGAYRYVVNAEGSVRDRYQERLQRLVEYQKRRGTDLLRTLEVYVENHGSITRTAAALFMHPNTLRQRLARIEQLARFELEKEDWLSLGMAVKLVKLGQIRGAKTSPLSDP